MTLMLNQSELRTTLLASLLENTIAKIVRSLRLYKEWYLKKTEICLGAGNICFE